MTGGWTAVPDHQSLIAELAEAHRELYRLREVIKVQEQALNRYRNKVGVKESQR
jgi:hypothetical protein